MTAIPYNAQPSDSRSTRQFLWVLYGALLAATVLYWVVLQILVSPGEERPDDILTYALGGAALGDAATVLFLRFVKIAPLLRPGPMSSAPDPDQHLLRLGKLRGHYILCYVLTEAVALFGFVLGFVSGDVNKTLPFFAAAGVLFALCYPRVPPDPLTGPTG